MDTKDLARSILAEIKARAEQARHPISADLLPRLEEVTSLLTETSVLRLAGTPDDELESVLRARFQSLTAATSIELADVVRDSARTAITSALHAAFAVVIGAVAP